MKFEHTTLLYTYLKRYQENPNSRVFAPLAEAYRKAGLIDEAIEIAREGLKNHPRFTGGRVALARALFDKKQFEVVISELLPVVHENPDNLVAQRLIAESCLMLGRVSEALGAYKMLLYFTPEDTETARLVWELEADAYEKGALILKKDSPPDAGQAAESSSDPLEFSVTSASSAFRDFDSPHDAPVNPSHSGPNPQEWRDRIERLQSLLINVERYRGRRLYPNSSVSH